MKNETLEPKHLAPYVPYSTQIKSIEDDGNVTILSGKMLDKYWMRYFVRLKYKPILRQLSSLSDLDLRLIIRHLFRDSQLIRPNYNKIECDKGFITIYDNNTMQRYTVVKPGGLNLPVLNMSNTFEDYEVFFNLKVDMYGLIQKGLAIDVDTL